MRLTDVIKFTTHVRPAGGLGTDTVIQLVVAGKSVSVDDAAEVLQMFLWMLARKRRIILSITHIFLRRD